MGAVFNQVYDLIKDRYDIGTGQYYAEKNRFWQCVFFLDDEYNNIVMRFELYENDRKTNLGKYRKVSHYFIVILNKYFSLSYDSKENRV